MLRNGRFLNNAVESDSKVEHEGWEITAALDAPELLVSVGHGEVDPTADHGAVAPALDLTRVSPKRKAAADFRDSLPVVVAFANSLPEEAPAVIFLPVRNHGRIESWQNSDDLQEKITKRISQAYPPIAFIQRIITTAPAAVLAVIVWGSNQRPHFAGDSFVLLAPRQEPPLKRNSKR